MPILSLSEYIAAPKQNVLYTKTAARTTIAATFFSLFDLAGSPGAGTLAVGNTANGIVPVAGQAGYPALNAFGAGADGHVSRVRFRNSVTGGMHVYDRLFKAGAYAFNADVTLAAQPDYSGRVLNFLDLEIWVEYVTASTGTPSVEVRYTNQAGVTGRTTGAISSGANPTTLGRCWQLPLQAGDSGVQRIERVIGTVASAGTFNVMVLRPLWENDVLVAGVGGINDMLSTGMPRVWATSALYVLSAPLGTSSGIPRLTIEVANG